MTPEEKSITLRSQTLRAPRVDMLDHTIGEVRRAWTRAVNRVTTRVIVFVIAPWLSPRAKKMVTFAKSAV